MAQVAQIMAVQILSAVWSMALLVALSGQYYVSMNINMMNLFTQFCDTDLEQYLKTHKFNETQIKSFLKQLSIGVKAMHDQGIYTAYTSVISLRTTDSFAH